MGRTAWLLWVGIAVTGAGCSGAATQFSSTAAGSKAGDTDQQQDAAANREPSTYTGEGKDASGPGVGQAAAHEATNTGDLSLAVLLSAPELRLGGQTIQAKALLDGIEEKEVRWSVAAAAGQDAGSISSTGLFRSPTAGSQSYRVKIQAVWLDDESVQAQAELLLVPSDQVFVSCKQNSQNFPILAEVYSLPAQTAKLPNFDQIASSKVTTVCMERYDVATRSWTAGFPGVPNLFEWFGLRTHSKLQVPVSGSYKFRLNSDDGAKLYIDGKLVIDNDGTHSPRALDAEVNLAAGSHNLTLDYFQGPRTQIALELFWIPANASAGSNFVYVPKENLR